METLSRVKIRVSRVGNSLEEMHDRSLGLDLLSWGGSFRWPLSTRQARMVELCTMVHN